MWPGWSAGEENTEMGQREEEKNKPEQKEVMAALQEEVVAEECGRRCTKRRAPELSQDL